MAIPARRFDDGEGRRKPYYGEKKIKTNTFKDTQKKFSKIMKGGKPRSGK